ncbi:MAG: hypothetical protein HUU43_05210 [Ignavibacteriaceae bacterium]|nr:hypothetical protein [Ignavibacteriaceae bacterium]NUM70224.1 hypothetical protein [Ignavibacteriaceae bacterium]
MKSLLFSFLTFLTLAGIIFPQDNLSFRGYVQSLQTAWIPARQSKWLTVSSFNNRLDLNYYLTDGLKVTAGVRNNFTYGEIVSMVPGYEAVVTADPGFFDLTARITSDTSYVLYTNADRLYIAYTTGNLELSAGRQRINWGINDVWNPNDIFNTFSYFDFDYEEKPGSDALRAQYYTGQLSSLELAVKADADKKITSALLFRFNVSGYDFQFFGGSMPDDYVAGAGWSGEIATAGFNGEITAFTPKESGKGKTEIIASYGLNYTFRDGLMFRFSMLFNSAGASGKAAAGTSVFNKTLSVKTLSPAKYSMFGAVSYPFTPLLAGSISGMFNPGDLSRYIGLSLDYSFTDNLYLTFISQMFFGDEGTEFGDYGKLFFLRLRQSF